MSTFTDMLKKKKGLSDPFAGVVDQVNPTDTPISTQDPKQLSDPYAGIDELFKPNQSDAAFKEHLLHPPTEDEPSLGKKLLTALVAGASGFTSKDPMAGIATADTILSDPYKKKMAAYDREGKGLQALSEMEDKAQGKKISAFNTKEKIRNDSSNEDIKNAQNEIKRLQAENGLSKDEATKAYHEAEVARQTARDSETIRHNQVTEGQGQQKIDKPTSDQRIIAVQEGTDPTTGEAHIVYKRAGEVLGQDSYKGSAQSQNKAVAANQIITKGNKILTMIQDNPNIGPVIGRIANGQVTIGNADPKSAELYKALKDFASLHPALHGARLGKATQDEFEKSIGNAGQDRENLITRVKNSMGTAQDVLDIVGKHSGATTSSNGKKSEDDIKAELKAAGVPGY